jgi:hypothetical protein
MEEGWEGVTLPAAQEASDSLRTQQDAGQLLREERETGPGQVGLAQYPRSVPGGRSFR